MTVVTAKDDYKKWHKLTKEFNHWFEKFRNGEHDERLKHALFDIDYELHQIEKTYNIQIPYFLENRDDETEEVPVNTEERLRRRSNYHDNTKQLEKTRKVLKQFITNGFQREVLYASPMFEELPSDEQLFIPKATAKELPPYADVVSHEPIRNTVFGNMFHRLSGVPIAKRNTKLDELGVAGGSNKKRYRSRRRYKRNRV